MSKYAKISYSTGNNQLAVKENKMSKKRVRFVVEIDSRLLPPFNEGEGLYEIANSAGFNKALAVPSRMLQVIYFPNFALMQGYNGVGLEEERKAWGPHLVKCMAEHGNLLRMLEQVNLVSYKIYSCFKDSVTIRLAFRRNREELGYLEMTFNRDGMHAGTSGNF